MFGHKYVKTAIRMLTILREGEEWTRVHLREACFLTSAIMKSSLYVRQNDKVHAHQITLLHSPLNGNHFLVMYVGLSMVNYTKST